MAVSGRYYIKMRLPDPRLVHGEDFAPPPGGGAPPAMPSDDVQIQLADHGAPGEDYFEGKMLFDFAAEPDGTLTGTADGAPIHWGYYTGDEFFKVEFPAGPGCWEVWARVFPDGTLEGMVSVGKGGGFPNLVYGARLPD